MVHLAHLVMALGIVAMAGPLGTPLLGSVWGMCSALFAAWFAVIAMWPDTDDPGHYQRRNRRLQLALANLAMAFMILVPAERLTGALIMTMSTGLGIYLLLHGGWLALRLVGAAWLVEPGFRPSPVSGALRMVYAPRIIAGCEVVTSVIMGVLLLAAHG